MPKQPKPRPARVLLLPPTRRDADAISALLAQANIACEITNSIADVCAAIDETAGVAIVSEESLGTGEQALAECLMRQPVWSDLPIIVLSRAGAASQVLEHSLATLGNISVMERPVRLSTFLSVIRSSLRARERQFQVRDHLIQRERVETELRRAREQQEMVVRDANVGVWYCPLPFDKLIWDATVKEHFHLPPDADVDINLFYERIHPEDRQRTREAIETSIASRRPYEVDYRTVSPDGAQTKWIRAMGRGFYDGKGAPTRFDGITYDVTERVHADQARRESEQRLLDSERAARSEVERASRMKDEFLATLSHELRNPLNAILGWAQLLRMSDSTPEEFDEGIQIIERNARAQTQIIEDLLDMSRIISGKIRLDVQRIDLAEVVRAAIETVQPAADAKGLRIRSVLDPRAGPISGDPSRLQQVFWNLLSNAVKFTPKDGFIQIVLERVNSHLEVSVSDSGEGIAAEFLPHVFDRFRQADATTTRQHGGLGLGLAIVRQVVELHGGRVSVASAGPGAGSIFTVSLPLAAMQAAQTDGTFRERRHPAAGPVELYEEVCAEIAGLRIVVVDDEPDARALLERLLVDCQAIVFTAASADEACKLIEQQLPDVLVSDIGMPGEDGFSLIRRVRSLPPDRGGDTPAVALTAYARAEDRVNVLRAGFQHHLSKPVEQAELIAVVANVARRPR
jgi:signal transduction histidine kinase/response regulator RpfG family c-di-GMP phosphodiesterase